MKKSVLKKAAAAGKKAGTRARTSQAGTSAGQLAAARPAGQNAGQAAAAIPAATALGQTAGDASQTNVGTPPRAPTPPIAPFLNADDLAALANFNKDLADKLSGIDKNLGDVQADTAYAQTQNEDGARRSSANSSDAMVARGLFQSSIKDAALDDIEAQRTLQQGYLNDRMTRAVLDAGTQKKALADWQTNYMKSLNAKAVENAQGITPATGYPDAPPVAASPTPLAKAATAAGKQAGLKVPGPVSRAGTTVGQGAASPVSQAGTSAGLKAAASVSMRNAARRVGSQARKVHA